MGQAGSIGQVPAMVGTAEAARILDRRPRTILRWAETGKLRVAMRMPGVTGAALFDRADVDALAAELAKEPAA